MYIQPQVSLERGNTKANQSLVAQLEAQRVDVDAEKAAVLESVAASGDRRRVGAAKNSCRGTSNGDSTA